MNNKAIILLSGGLDSVVSLSLARKSHFDVCLALTFDYGQKAFGRELKSSEEISSHYNIEHKVIKLDWLKEIIDYSKDWIPNRNGVFLNIASSFAERYNIDNVIIGINREEALTFKDNTKEFLMAVNNELRNSTQNEVKVLAPLVDCDKEEIVKIGIENNIPFEKIYSCYFGAEKHCGVCASCQFLKSALIKNNRQDLINKLF